MRWIPLAVLTLLLLSPTTRAAEGFELKDTPGQHLDVLLDGKIAARYMYAHDTSTKEKRLETYKPYLHVFDAEGKEPITQGAGGKQFPHHRGIYIGWKKIAFEGKQYNLWEMASGDIVHDKFLNQHADADSATFTSLTHWNLNKPSTTIIDEERTMTFHRAPAPGRLIIDFTSKLTAPSGDLVLDADPEHGGVQYRPAGDIVAKETVYEFPTQHADPHKDKDYAWAAETYTLRGHRYSVVEINSPENPTGTRWSAYRDYGRFGAFPKASLKKGDALTLKYRFLIAEGELPPTAYIQKQANDFTGQSTETPKTTVRPADGAKPPTPKKPK